MRLGEGCHMIRSSPGSWFVRLKSLINHRDNVGTGVRATKREITFLRDWAQTSINSDPASLPSVPDSLSHTIHSLGRRERGEREQERPAEAGNNVDE